MESMSPKGQETEPIVPTDLKSALAADCAAEAAWQGLTPISRRDFISWINGAKRAETREKRIRVCCDKLVKGERRPCCYAVVPMDLYRALGAEPRAKAQWSALSANEKRDFSDWVENSEDKETRIARVKRAIALLADGNRAP